ncbi:MAG: peroxiredoxin [Phycisphaera sp.]|nr:MAG: peroxiredoxin [Phycisphaera sp.]
MQATEKVMKPLQVGDESPDFALKGASYSTLFQLIREQKIPAFVYFYPADFSPACTAQACMMRNTVRRESATNGVVIGVSPQGAGLHRAFQSIMHLPQQLVSDRNKEIGRSYGAVGPLGIYRRLSYIISEDKRILMMAEGGLAIASHKKLAKKYFEILQYKHEGDPASK